MSKTPMTAAAILGSLFELGVRFEIYGQRIRYRAPQGVMTPKLIDQLAKCRSEVLELLRRQANEARPLPHITSIPRTSTQSWPLSFSQQRLWFLNQIDPESSAYNIPVTLRVGGRLNTRSFENALNRVIDRHESLRTHFVSEHGRPAQIINPRLKLTIPIIDLSHLPAERREEEAVKLAGEDPLRPFQLDRLPLFRATILHLNLEEHWIVFTMHHIISDGWSLEVLVREVTELYREECGGNPAALEALPVQYADYAYWQRNVISDQFERQSEYWIEHLANPPALELPTDHPRFGARSGVAGECPFIIPASLRASLEEIGNVCGATLFMTLLAAFQLLLSHYSGQEDVVVGFPIANRTQTEVEGLIGFFVNVLLLRTDLSGDPLFRDVLIQVRTRAFDAYAHQDVPFEYLVNRLQPQRSLSRTPLFDVLFVFQNTPSQVLRLSGLTIEEIPAHRRSNPYELMIVLRPNGDHLDGRLAYNMDLFNHATIERYAHDFLSLLEIIAAMPHARISDILGPINSALALSDSSQSGPAAITTPFHPFSDEEIEQSIAARFEAQARRRPEQVAVQSRRYRWTYGELDRAANRVARALIKNRRNRHERIALLFEHDAPMVLGMLAVLKSAKTYVPLDPAYPVDRHQFQLNDAGVTVILTNNLNFGLASSLASEKIAVLNLDEISEGELAADLPDPAGAHDLACIIYSSGSTGAPKGTLQYHRSILHIVANYTQALHLAESDRSMVLSSYAHVMAMIDIYAPLMNGATLYPVNVKAEGIADLGRYIFDHEITIYRSPASLFRLLATNLERGDEMTKLRAAVLGAEPVLAGDFELYRNRCSPGCVLVNTYGSTEATISVVGIFNKDTQLEGEFLPIGYPVGKNEVFLLNPSGRPTPFFGQIAIRNPYLPSRYWNRDEESARAFYRDPTAPLVCTYRTGDFAKKRADGLLVLTGRSDQQIKIRGFRVELGEIEAVLRRHPAVERVAVLAAEDTTGNQRLHAYVVPNPGKRVSRFLLLEHARKFLPDYMVPATFVLLQDLPLTPNGKLDRRALSEVYQFSGGEKDADLRSLTPLEEIVAGIWSEVLAIDQVPVDMDFFDLGGHSLLATQIISRLRESLRLQLPMRVLFEDPTVERLSRRIQMEFLPQAGLNWKSLTSSPRDKPVPLSHAQERLWLLSQLAPEGAYNLPFAFRIRGQLNVQAFERALQILIERHEPLRTRFMNIDGLPMQMVEPNAAFSLPIIDLRASESEESDQSS